MEKRHSRLGLFGSLVLHSAVFGGIWWATNQPNTPQKATDELTSISMEMMTAILEQPQVAVAPEEPELPPEPIPEPEPIVEKPKEKPKKKPKPKPKEKPPVKAVEKGKEVKQGVAEKAIPNALQGNRLQVGESGTANASRANEVNAYKAQLQRALQQRANNAYPQREKMMRRTGTVTISFTIAPSGQITNVVVLKSSNNSNLDSAAVKAAQSTKMPSGPPAGFPTTLSVPVKFSLL
ncbi:MAG: TonB family protein [Pasteurellaceae bacterium]|nr:TonB family protein [Pasteurellaceae bacterium]